MYKMHHPKSDVDRLYQPRTEGGRGLQYNWSFPTSQPPSVLINTSRRRRTPSSTLSKTITTGNPCTLSADSQWRSVGNWECLQYHLQRKRANTTHVRRTKAKAKHQGRQQLKSQWESNALHGKYPQRVKQVRGPRQDPQMAKSSWPQGRNRGFNHRSLG